MLSLCHTVHAVVGSLALGTRRDFGGDYGIVLRCVAPKGIHCNKHDFPNHVTRGGETSQDLHVITVLPREKLRKTLPTESK